MQGSGYEAGLGGVMGGGVQRADVQTALGQVLKRAARVFRGGGESLCVKESPPASLQSASMLADVLPVPFSQLCPPAARPQPKRDIKKHTPHATHRTNLGYRLICPVHCSCKGHALSQLRAHTLSRGGGINTMWSTYF